MTSKTTLTATEAAAYLGMTVRQFLRAVEREELPKAFIRTRPARWSRVQLDWALEGKAVSAPASSGGDPIMEHLERCGST